MELKVWTAAYRPFMIGGDVRTPIATVLEVGEPVDIGKGMTAYVIVSPSGQTFIAESTTGAFVGNSLEAVRRDVIFAPPAVMREQLERAAIEANRATLHSVDDFWRMFK